MQPLWAFAHVALTRLGPGFHLGLGEYHFGLGPFWTGAPFHHNYLIQFTISLASTRKYAISD